MSHRRLFTPEQHEWLRAHYADMTNAELAEAFETEFGCEISEGMAKSYGSNHHLRKSAEARTRALRHGFTQEEDDFLREHIPGHGWRETSAAFEGRFGRPLTKRQISNKKARLGVRSGTVGGRFEKGHEPPNKGRTWDEYMPEESQERCRDTQFRRGGRPRNAYHRLLDERVDPKYGRAVYVRPRDAQCTADYWISEARFVWMRANGRDFPAGHRLVHADHDRDNNDPDNLVAVPEDVYCLVSAGAHGHAYPYHDRPTLEVAVNHARLYRERLRLEREAPRECAVCGNTFVPGQRANAARVRTCPDCLARGRRASWKMGAKK